MRKTQPTSHHWGSGLAIVDNHKLAKVISHPQDPDPSRINENIVTGIYGNARVQRPAIRKSYLEHGPGKFGHRRGEETFIEVDYDAALALVADELKRVRAEFGNESIFAGSYGWASAGRFHHAQSQLKRFLTAAGGFVRSEGNYSYHAALVLMPHIVGNFRDHIREATRWSTVAREGKLVVMFGGLPIRNAQVSGGGVAKHRLRGDLMNCAEAGVRFVNLSPLKTDAVEALNAEWLPPIPGTDTAIMMGLAHSLLLENKYDQAFLSRYTVGFERISAYLKGEVDGVVKDVHWASAICGIRAEKLHALALKMASERTLICTTASLQRARYGEQPLWMTVTLAAMLGQIGLPGGGYGIAYAADSTIGTVNRPVSWPSLPQGDNPVEEYIPVACIADMLLNPGGIYQYNGQDRCYPNIKLVWWAGGNPFHHHQDLNNLRRAFARPDTIIVNEINWTATARHADIVLPVASSMERTDFGAGTQDNAVIPMPRVIDPVGESREEYQIYCDLELRLNLGTAFSLGRTTEQWLHQLWGEMIDNAHQQGYHMPDFETFIAGDIIHLNDPDPQVVFLSQFRQNPEKNPLPTPSGKIELYSDVINSFGYEDCPGHPVWLPSFQITTTENDNPFPLHLISGQPDTRLHSQYDAGAFSLSKKIGGREPVLIHPDNAAQRNINDGDIVRLYNDRGSCLAGAVITNQVRQGAVFLWTGAWYDPDFSTSDHRDNHGNPNVLTHDLRTSRLSQGPTAQALIQMEKFDGEPPPVRAFDPPIVTSDNRGAPD